MHITTQQHILYSVLDTFDVPEVLQVLRDLIHLMVDPLLAIATRHFRFLTSQFYFTVVCKYRSLKGIVTHSIATVNRISNLKISETCYQNSISKSKKGVTRAICTFN